MDIKTMGVLGSINVPIDIQSLSSLEQYRYSNSRGYLKVDGNITACFYKTGKIQIYGIKKIDKIQYYWDIILDKIKNCVDISKADSSPKLKFIVAYEKLPYKVNIQVLSHTLINENIEYEPEQFPALVWKLTHCSCLLFSTGSCVLTGANSIDKINSSIADIKSKIESVDGAILKNKKN